MHGSGAPASRTIDPRAFFILFLSIAHAHLKRGIGHLASGSLGPSGLEPVEEAVERRDFGVEPLALADLPDDSAGLGRKVCWVALEYSPV